MRTKFITAGLAALALAVPASASAATTYSGNFEPTGTLQFTVSNNKVKEFQFSGFPLNCGGASKTTSGNLTFDVRVKKGHFEAAAVLGNADRPKAKLKLVGDIDGALASGTMNIKGRKVPLDGGGRGKCHSGNVAWTAAAQVKSASGRASAAKFARP